MPNGFHSDATIDVLVHRHTEHGQPGFWTYKSDGGVIAAHLEHHRGYAYDGDWGVAKLGPCVRGRRIRPTRVEAAAVAAEVVEKLKAVMASNPRSVVAPTEASAFLFFDGWGVLFGDYHLYVRARGAAFQRIEPPLSRKPDLVAALSTDPELAHAFSRTHVAAVPGLWMHEPDQCVHDLALVDEWIVTTAPLHEQPSWEQIARAPLDSVESTGSLVLAVREHAIERGTDHLVIVRRCAGRVGEPVVTGGGEPLPAPARPPTPSAAAPPAAVNEERGGAYLQMVYGPEVGRPFQVKRGSLLGRGGDCDVYIDSEAASRHHARIQKTDQRYLIVDLGTTNGTFVNGLPVHTRLLEEGDLVTIGAVHLRFSHELEMIWDGHLRIPREGPLLDVIAKELPRCGRGEGDVALVVVAVDSMKRVNDGLGFIVGDRVLAHVEAEVKKLLRPEDVLVRIGGDTFGVVALDLDRSRAKDLAARIEQAVAATPLVVSEAQVPATVTCGIATAGASIGRPWQLLRRAQGNLYDERMMRRFGMK